MNKAIKTGVIGHPVAHSLSPLIHDDWRSRYGISGSYDALDIAPDHLAAGVADLVARGYRGFNVTIPHKQAIMPLCAALDDTARAIGAVNTVDIKDGQLYGRNTDAFGFIENIRRSAPDFDFTAGPALVLGAGGAARAVIYGLQQQGVPEILITNRTAEKAEALATSFNLKTTPWGKRNEAIFNINLLVNTTSLGMKGQPPLNIELSTLPGWALVCDIVYKPLMTDLLSAAAARGNPIVTGIGMLLHQARPGFELWNGVRPDVTADLQQKVLEAAQ